VLGQTFGKRFISDHAGKMVTHPEIAIVELVANSWDAGSMNVKIKWPNDDGYFEIADDGIGMNKKEFEKIWRNLNYSRIDEKGKIVDFPPEVKNFNREAYGTNGKGRHSMFCFADVYNVEIWKDGSYALFEIRKSYGERAFDIKCISEGDKKGHGTKLSCKLVKNHVETPELIKILGSKFITDPTFSVYLNDKRIDLIELKDYEEFKCPINVRENIRILRVDSEKSGRTSKHNGVAWWVNNRLVKSQSWKQYLDARRGPAKKVTFIIMADLLKDEVSPDWTGFKDNKKVKIVTEKVNKCMQGLIADLIKDVNKQKKREAIMTHRDNLRLLSDVTKSDVSQFMDFLLIELPNIKVSDLTAVIDILTKMELTRTGYDLLHQIAKLSNKELDDISDILDTWSVTDAKHVLDQLYWRLALIKKLEILVDDPKTKELQDLQPLFEAGLWIFGPEYEGLEKYTSNERLSTFIKKYFEKKKVEVVNPQKRPDFVILPDSSIGVYSYDDHDGEGEVDAIKKLLIVELKKGGHKITKKEKRQALDYAMDLIDSGAFSSSYPKILCYVLGSRVDPRDIEPSHEKDKLITAEAKTYETVLRKAHGRTFKLIKKIKDTKGISVELEDEDMKEILEQRSLIN
jgi:hypothetical protein